jgi:hypothetical protein
MKTDQAPNATPEAVCSTAMLGAWQPIETAPRDGTWVLLTGGECFGEDDGERTVVAQWDEYGGGTWHFAWYDDGYYGAYYGPTHWMPLPAPPESA